MKLQKFKDIVSPTIRKYCEEMSDDDDIWAMIGYLEKEQIQVITDLINAYRTPRRCRNKRKQ